MSFGPLAQLAVGGSALAFGLVMLIAPRRWRQGRIAETDRALTARMARGTDAWFEEKRSLEA